MLAAVSWLVSGILDAVWKQKERPAVTVCQRTDLSASKIRSCLSLPTFPDRQNSGSRMDTRKLLHCPSIVATIGRNHFTRRRLFLSTPFRQSHEDFNSAPDSCATSKRCILFGTSSRCTSRRCSARCSGSPSSNWRWRLTSPKRSTAEIVSSN